MPCSEFEKDWYYCTDGVGSLKLGGRCTAGGALSVSAWLEVVRCVLLVVRLSWLILEQFQHGSGFNNIVRFLTFPFWVVIYWQAGFGTAS